MKMNTKSHVMNLEKIVYLFWSSFLAIPFLIHSTELMSCSGGSGGGGGGNTRPTLWAKIHSYAVFGENWSNSMLALLQGVAPPGKSRILYCCVFKIEIFERV